jgi:hypothetical protein
MKYSITAGLSPEPMIFRPFVLTRKLQPNVPAVIREGRISFDNTMPRLDARKYERPAFERIAARSVCAAEFAQ